MVLLAGIYENNTLRWK